MSDREEASPARFKQIITRLALGLMRQDEAIQKGVLVLATKPDDQFQSGWDDLTTFCHILGVAPPRHLPELVVWLHQPIETWGGFEDLALQADISGRLLSYGAPSEQCMALSREMHLASDPERELQDVPFKEILSYCKHNYTKDPRLIEQYRKARLFLVTNPYLPYGAITITSNSYWDSEIRKWLRQCYEPLPRSCYQQINGQSKIALCPRCGWPLEWPSKKVRLARCYSDLCGQLVSTLHYPTQWLEAPIDAMRTTRGIQSSVVAPEVPLLRLKERIEQEFGFPCELWPEIDNFDLLVTRDRERLAIDMKDHVGVRKLAEEATAFPLTPAWDQAFYIFPEHRRQPGYFRTFSSLWKQPPKTQALFVNDFLRYLREYESDGGEFHA
jgi:hypothetical protein